MNEIEKTQKLREYFEDKGITQTELATRLTVTQSHISQMLTGKKPISKKRAQQLAELYGLSYSWLLTGEGEMMQASPAINAPASDNPNSLPYFGELPVSGGRIVQYSDIKQQMPSGYIDIPQTRGADFLFPVVGCSMAPTIEEGDIIGVRHTESFEAIDPDRVYMLVTRDNERMIKRILRYDATRALLTLGSDNPRVPDFTVPADMVIDIYKVTVLLRIETV